MTTTEDGAFWQHAGLNDFLLRRAIRLDLDYGRYVYGGSTLTQQLVKNLYLTRTKVLSRKLEELLIVWQMERRVPKTRILETYVNGVEYGPRLYGVVRAARAYFAKEATALAPVEAAFLGAIKPCPSCGWAGFHSGHWAPWWSKRIGEVLSRMQAKGIVTAAQVAAADPFVPDFVGWDAAKMARARDKARKMLAVWAIEDTREAERQAARAAARQAARPAPD